MTLDVRSRPFQKREKEIKALEAMIGEFEYEDDNDEQNRKRDEVTIPTHPSIL